MSVSNRTNSSIIHEELERRIVYGLSCEWDNALWVLNHAQKRLMRKPLIRLGEMKHRLGHWSPEKREICMAREFVLNHPWDSVCDVLRHEIAHQYTHEVMGAYNEPPHGPSFKKACHLLRASPRASGRYITLRERLDRCEANAEDKLLMRIKKLMALAQSQNRHEAEAAMLKAHELIKKYNIDLLARDRNREFISVFVGKPALRYFREFYSLANLIQDYYFVQCVWVPAYVIEKGKMGRVLEISGTPRNVRLAEYIHAFVGNYIDSRWNSYNEPQKLNRYRKTDFAVGIIRGFRSKLKIQEAQKSGEVDQRALVEVRDPKLDEYISWRFPRLTSFSRGSTRQDQDVYNDGVKIGKKLVIAKGIESTGESGKLLTN